MDQKYNYPEFNDEFRLVELDIFNIEKTIVAKYFLLVDDDNRIHHYNVEFLKATIQISTTAQHEIKKKNNYSYKFRKDIIKILGYQHLLNYNGEKKPEPIILNSSQIKLCNDFFYNYWYGQTFQNIIYVMSGCNATGEGNPNGARFFTEEPSLKKGKIALSFFLQELNISRYTFKKNDVSEYNKKIKSLLSKKETITFLDWVNSNVNHLRRNLIDFNNCDKSNDSKWKLTKKRMREYYSSYLQELRKIDNKILSKRNEAKKKLKRIEFYFKNFWSTIENYRIQYAHIKPVWKIKKEYQETNDENILEQICDTNNFLPLQPTIHDYYDNNLIAWDINGKILINFLKIEQIDKSSLEKYKQIPFNQLALRKKYISEYLEIIKEKNLKLEYLNEK